METKFFRFGVASVVKKFGEDPILIDIEGISAAPCFKVNGKMVNLTDEASQSDLQRFSMGELSIEKKEILEELPHGETLESATEKKALELSNKIMGDTLLKIADVVFKSEDKTEDMKKVEQLLLEYDKQKHG